MAGRVIRPEDEAEGDETRGLDARILVYSTYELTSGRRRRKREDPRPKGNVAGNGDNMNSEIAVFEALGGVTNRGIKSSSCSRIGENAFGKKQANERRGKINEERKREWVDEKDQGIGKV
ncbi:hypothetical protein WN55_10369 [Dufourea novaeangliae]|uniref:Uncharacterized protein n=1 Tax=Dufourea novaeangliae TaxID=178035 RepID=A0A154P5I9_DUFNO|nr:hypothetical protein WN55_10369 [Dufourea novaeangliae]